MIDFGSAPDSFSRDRRPPAAGVVPVPPPLSMQTPLEELPRYLALLNDRQREAALITEGPLIVLAGAGSGKTRMVTSRIAYLIGHRGIAPYQILAMTFTNKAAGEMRDRVEKTLAEGSEGERGFETARFGTPEIGTFHAICVRILRREMQRLPFEKNFTIYDDSDQHSLIKSVMSKLNIDDKTYSPQSFQAAINRAKCEAQEPHEVQVSPHSPFQRCFQKLYEQYQKDLFASNAVDFGEIICMTYRLLRDHEDVRRRYQSRYRYIHVDEYQDTNRAQYLLLSMLAGRDAGGHHNICVVGDEDQSIYKWRGADIRNILDFEKDFGGASVVKLEQNYRSTKTIISAASHVIRNNRQRKEKFLWTENEEGMPIFRFLLPDERSEAETVVSEIKRIVAESTLGLDDFAIFYRTHAQSRQLEDLLRRDKIAYQIVGGLRFYERKEIKDVMSYFKVIQNPSDSVSLRRIVNVPARGIGKTTLDKIEGAVAAGSMTGTGPKTLWEGLVAAGGGHLPEAGLTPRTAKKIHDFCELLRRLTSDQPTLMLSELYHRLLDLTAYVIELKKDGTIEAQARIENLEELDNLIKEFEEETYEGRTPEEITETKGQLLLEFLERTSLVTVDEGNVEVTSVKMMTLHSSKGLEFPVVFMVGMEEGLFPSIRPDDGEEEGELEEERRLCYVGMTRARQRLFMLGAVCRRIWGTIHYHDPSRFLSEIPDEYVKFIDLSRSRWGRQDWMG